MAVDKKIEFVEYEDFLPDTGFNYEDSIYSNIYMSIHTKKGVDRFADKSFGSTFHLLVKNGKITATTLTDAENCFYDCTKWMVKSGRISGISVLASLSPNNISRIELKTTVIVSGKSITYKLWYDII